MARKLTLTVTIVSSIFHDIGTAIFYKNVFIDLCYPEDPERAPLFLSTISTRDAALIRCLRLPIHPIHAMLPRCTCLDMLNKIASNFLKLETIILVWPAPEGAQELPAELEMEMGDALAPRIGAILQRLGECRTCRIMIERAGPSQAHGGDFDESSLVPYPMTHSLQHRTVVEPRQTDAFESWNLLPERIKRAIIQFAVLEPDRLIHPLHSMSTSPETATIMPLLLASRNISRITADVVYRDATFASCLQRDRRAMYAWFQRRTPQQLQMIERYNINGLDRWIDRRFLKFLKSRCPNARDMEPSYLPAFGLHPCWNGDAHQWSAFLDESRA
jgi:hypothetical protein